MKKKYEKPSFETIEMELDKCIAVNTSVTVPGGQASNSVLNDSELGGEYFDEVIDLNPTSSTRSGSRW